MNVARQIVDVSKATLNSMENRLASVLKPVPPRKEFVSTLGNQIQTLHHSIIVNRLTNTHTILILLAGILSTGALLLIGIRAIFSFMKTHRKTMQHG
jgi:hypothetical protein